ncbi:unnamed protein product [Lactuca saligna]|uniref:Uncharacterized protein n=1 Tax=Lactuca saligna TaxID=75948 RepID=A0AA35V8Z7_LACSI|nr:unnamed protein product [Lactuca saligna]
MHQSITSFFSSQSTKCEKSILEDEKDDDDVIVSFEKIQFNPEEHRIPDHMFMLGKQFKILNYKLNLLLQIQADTWSRNSMSGIEVDIMLKTQEHHLKMAMDQI